MSPERRFGACFRSDVAFCSGQFADRPSTCLSSPPHDRFLPAGLLDRRPEIWIGPGVDDAFALDPRRVFFGQSLGRFLEDWLLECGFDACREDNGHSKDFGCFCDGERQPLGIVDWCGLDHLHDAYLMVDKHQDGRLWFEVL